MKRIALASIFLLLAPAARSGAQAAGPILVEAGVSRMPIVIAAEAPPTAVEAAGELAEYLEKVGGARPEVVTGVPEPTPASAIWVGFQPRLTALFPEIDFRFARPEEILISASPAHLVLAGRDRQLGETWVEHGTANAVYTFIQDYLGVRWLWPGELGEDIEPRETIRYAPFTHRFSPPFLTRDIFIIRGQRTPRNPRGIPAETLAWRRRQRLTLSSRQGPAGSHAFTKWWDWFSESHPEYFALQPDGTRSGWPNAKHVKLCKSNSEVWRQWLAAAAADVHRKPALNYLRAAANDAHSSGLCVCKRCRAWDHPDGQPWTYNWAGARETYVMVSDRYVTFWNNLARLLKDNFPERDDLFVRVNAYGPNLMPPVGPGLAENTIMGFVGMFPTTTDAERERQKQLWLAWSGKAPNMIYRPNLWYWCGGVWGLPEVSLTQTIEDFRFLAENSCIGLTIDVAREYWATLGPMYYLMSRLAWNPLADGRTLLEDYYTRGFGPAAPQVGAYWELMERARDRFAAHPELRLGSAGRFAKTRLLPEIYTAEVLGEADALLSAADAQLAGTAAIYRRRLAVFRAGAEITRLMVESVPLMTRARETGGMDFQAVRAAAAKWKRMQEAVDEIGRDLYRFDYVLNVMHGGYMGGVADFLGPPSERFLQAAERAEAAARKQPEQAAATRAPADESSHVTEARDWVLVFRDDFARTGLGAEWRVVDGTWSVADGVLTGQGVIVLSHRFRGSQRLEFEAATTTEQEVSDLSSFLNAREAANLMRSGYFFQFGGQANTNNQLRRAGSVLGVDDSPARLIEPGKRYRIIAENDEGRLRLIVNDQVYFEMKDAIPLTGAGQDITGFYFHSGARVDSVRLYVKEAGDDMI